MRDTSTQPNFRRSGWILIGFLAVGLGLVVGCMPPAEQPVPATSGARPTPVSIFSPTALGVLEAGIAQETNLLRSDPAAYAAHLEQLLPRFRGNLLHRMDGSVIQTREGAAAVREAIRALRATSPRPRLTSSRGVARAAGDHVRDQGPRGLTGHTGADGSTPSVRLSRYGRWEGSIRENISYGPSNPREVVVDLLVDDAVPNRGHRVTLLDPVMRVTGVGCGPHRGYGTMCVMDYAAGYIEGAPTPGR